MLITYTGFVQSGSIRLYNFEARSNIPRGLGIEPVGLSVSTDMSIVSAFQLRIQDLPALCHHTIVTAIEALPAGQKSPTLFVLTEANLRAHCHAVATSSPSKEHRRRIHGKPSLKSDISS